MNNFSFPLQVECRLVWHAAILSGMVNGPCGLIISWVFVIQSIKNLTLAIHIEDNETECE